MDKVYAFNAQFRTEEKKNYLPVLMIMEQSLGLNIRVVKLPNPLSSIHPFFFFLATLHSLWDLSFLQGIEPGPLALKASSLNHWTTREFPIQFSNSVGKRLRL